MMYGLKKVTLMKRVLKMELPGRRKIEGSQRRFVKGEHAEGWCDRRGC